METVAAVEEEAARSLADMAREAVKRQHDGAGHQMAIELRDVHGPVLQVRSRLTGGMMAKPK
jgi:hypothetical protein